MIKRANCRYFALANEKMCCRYGAAVAAAVAIATTVLANSCLNNQKSTNCDGLWFDVQGGSFCDDDDDDDDDVDT